jgi:DNA-binding helix-hairpin-helix protein with protein kinase domain
MLQTLERQKRDLQMRKHLEANKVAFASIPKVGEGRKMNLRSFGIETAWDVNARAVGRVSGFGPALTSNVVAWRRSVEAQFRFNPSQPTDPVEIARVRAEIATRRRKMETDLLKGVGELEAIRAAAMAARRNAGQHQEAYLAHLQGKTDAAALGRL